MARPDILDTSVLIHLFRDPRRADALFRRVASGHTWLSAIAVAELYAGTRSSDDALMIARLVAVMQRIDRMLTPTDTEWVRAGRLLARHVRVRGDIQPRDHLADVLILVSAARLNGAIVTLNVRHFETWAALANASGLDVAVTPFQP
jgi:predicted nucleic acid-binding protein